MLFFVPTMQMQMQMPVTVRAARVVHSHCEQEHG